MGFNLVFKGLDMLHTLRFSLQNAVYFIMQPFLVSVLFTFYVQRVLKFNLLATEFHIQILAHSVCKM
jgi:hypothetical protein